MSLTGSPATGRRDSDGTNDQTIDVAAAWAGLIGVGLFVVGSLLAGSPPKPDASATEITAFLVAHRSALLTGTALILLAIPFLGCFVGVLTGVLRDAEGGRGTLARAAALGWTLQLAIVAIGIVAQTAVTWRGAAGLDPHLVHFAYDLGTLSLYTVSATAVALTVGATSVVIFRSGVLPRWLVAIGVVEVAVNLIELLGLSSRSGLNAGGYAAGVGPLLWSVWAAAVAVSLARHLRRAP
jgi:hypothetical protein